MTLEMPTWIKIIVISLLLVLSRGMLATNPSVAPAVAAQIDAPTTETSTPTPGAEPPSQTDAPTPTPTETPVTPTDTPTAVPTETATPAETPTPGETPVGPAATPAAAPGVPPTEEATQPTAAPTPTAILANVPASAPAFTELFFSEYVEGSSNNKALEIFNGTGGPINLPAEHYEVQIYYNGSLTPTTTIALTGVVATGDVYVLAHNAANPAILTQSDQRSGALSFNGDDAISLRRNGVILDVIGQIGFDPGAEWGSGLTSTADNTLHRKISIVAGDPDGANAFDPAIEWDGFNQDTFDGLGIHLSATPTPTVTITATPVITLTPTITVTPIITLTPTVTGTPVVTSTPLPTPPPPVPGSVVINEVAWGGTKASAADEWIELYNTTTQPITLTNWLITSTNGLSLPLKNGIGPNSYYLIERSDDNTVIDVTADLTITFNVALNNTADALFLSANGLTIDTANGDGGNWLTGSGSPNYLSMERESPLIPDADTNWASNDTIHRNGLAADNITPINGTPKQPNSTTYPPPPPAAPILIGEFLYDGVTPSTEGDEFVELCNPITTTVSLAGYKVGDEETRGGGESMYELPATATLAANACLVVAKDATQFQARFGFPPDLAVGNLHEYKPWGGRNWNLANDGDELVVLGPNDEILDSVAYRNGNYAALGLEADASASEPTSLQRVWPTDTNSMPYDFVRAEPNPGRPTAPPPPVSVPPALLPDGMYAFWGDLHAHTTYSDGAGPAYYALAVARSAGLHFYAITDHDWWLTPLEWANLLTQTRQASLPGQFIALRGVEWTHDSVGHINLFNTDTLPNSRTDPTFNTLPAFYAWLAAQPEVIAQFNHPDPDYGGAFDNFAYHPAAAQVMFMQEVGNNAQKYTTYEPSFIQSNSLGWKTAPTNNGDTHTAQWGRASTARTGLLAPALTEADLLAAMRARRVFATEDSNLAVALRLSGSWMGSSLTTTGPLPLTVDVVDPDAEPFTLYLYDNNLPLAAAPLAAGTGQWSATVNALPGHFFWVKVLQADGNAAYTAPVWIEGQAPPETLYVNEVLPSPHDRDWDGSGVADYQDEWIELFNPADHPIGLGGWQLRDNSRIAYTIPLETVIPAQGYAAFYQAQTHLSLNNGGDTVSLVHPTGAVADSFSYDHSPGYDGSWCRLPSGGSRWSEDCGPSPNAANWEKAPNGPLTRKIFDAKRLTDNAWVRVKGHVTAPPGVLGVRSMYIQDNTAGILIYLPKNHGLSFKLGDRVEVVGNLRTFHNEFEIVVGKRSGVKFLEPGLPPPPLPIATTSLLEPYEGMLVMLQGRAVDFKGWTTIWLDDGTGWAKSYLRRSTGIKKPYLKLGTAMTIVGIVSQYSDEDEPSRLDYRLLPRYQSDILINSPAAAAPANWPKLLPDTGN